jgi:LysM repeat protein
MRRTLAALALAVVLPLPLFAAEVTVQPGETLSDLADRHGVSLSRLMKANGITNADRVEAGQRLTIPGGGGRQAKVTGSKVTVKPGETLSEIADRHGMSLSKLLQLNGISNPDHVEVGQSLVVSGAVKTASAAKGSSPAFSYAPGARDHVVRPGESLSAIAKGYGVPVSRLVALNRIENPNKVEAGDRLRLQGTPPTNTTTSAPKASPRTSAPRPTPVTPTPVTPTAKAPTKPATLAKATAPAPAGPAAGTATTATATWRTYGPLQVDWSNWQPMGGSLVAASLNASGQPFYLAINCSARKLNATTADGQWKTWDDPATDFEKKLVTDLCKSRPG